jgi:hypothetical protein
MNRRLINYLMSRYRLRYYEARELTHVIDICIQQNFIFSRDLSNFIIENNLGFYFPNICGVLYMNDGCNQWKFYGGFSQKIYKILCFELNLVSRRSNASTTRFIPYKNFLR